MRLSEFNHFLLGMNGNVHELLFIPGKKKKATRGGDDETTKREGRRIKIGEGKS